ESVRVLGDFPADARAFEAVHGRSFPNAAELGSIDAARQLFRKIGPIAQEAATAKSVRKALRSARDGDLIAVIAHNDHGLLRFSDGSVLAISELTDQSSRATLAILTCNGL